MNIRKMEKGVAVRFTFVRLLIPGIDLNLVTGIQIGRI